MVYRDTIRQQDLNKAADVAMNDEEIIRRVVNGDKDLYSLIVRKYNQRLYRIGLSIINNDSAIEDIMQSTYIKAYENLDKFKFEAAFSTWITRILINESLQYLKKQEQVVQRESRATPLHPGINAREPQTPLMKVIDSELKAVLELTIKKLPEKYRTVFVMRELENMNVAETMECLGLTEANVKVRLNRAKVMLRDKLKNYIKEEELLQFYKPRCDRVVGNVMEMVNAGTLG